MKLGFVRALALMAAVSACAVERPAYYRIAITDPAQTTPSFHEEAIISLWALYTSGHCGEQYPILEDQNIYTPSCGLSESALRDRLSRLAPLAEHTVFPSNRDEYTRALARNERMRVN